MRDFVGGDADNLDFSGYTYQQLRAAVYGVSEEAVRVAGNEWADLKRRLNERVGTLHVTVARLASVWGSPAGRQALNAFRAHREWMAELARVAAVNEAHLDDVQAVRVEAVTKMRVLDMRPGGPVAPGARPRPAPSPGPAPQPSVWPDPASLDWRQPQAVTIANRLYGQLAIAAASMAVPPTAPQPISELVGATPQQPGPSGTDEAVTGRSSAAGRTSDGATWSQTLAGTPFAAGSVATGRHGVGSDGGSPVRRSPTALNSGGAHGAGGSRGAGIRGTGRAGHLGGRPLNTGTGAAATEPPGRVLGGGSRPPLAVPEMPPQGPGSGGPSGEPYGPARRKRHYERAEADTFVDKRPRNAAGGGLPIPEEPGRFAPLPGTVGNQKYKPVANDPRTWGVDTRPPPDGFPEKLETFTRRDGVTFEVRRRRGGL